MGQRWSVERVMAAAPDSESAVAGRRLAGPGPWAEVGCDGPVIWGRCRGSAREPYRVVVDTAAPRYQCTCPSRKFPCKHALGLLFRWAEGRFPDDLKADLDPGPRGARDERLEGSPSHGGPRGARDERLEGSTSHGGPRGARDERLEGSPSIGGPRGARDERLEGSTFVAREGSDTPDAEPGRPTATGDKAAAAAARAAARDDRVAAGLAELDRWIADCITGGLAGLADDPEQFEHQAARMIDAQAPGMARWLRRLRVLSPGSVDWATRVLSDLALMRVLIRAFNRREALPGDLLATVRAHLGFTVAKAEVLATAAIPDQWVVVGLHDTQEDERIVTRRVWLHGRTTGRFAVVLLFSVNGLPYDLTISPGMELDADLHFYPGRPALRALIGVRRSERDRVRDLRTAGHSIAEARDCWAAAIAADPWLTLWPITLRGRLAVADSVRGLEFRIIDPIGGALPVTGPESILWQALAISGGAEFTWFGELSPVGFTPLAAVDRERSTGALMVL